MQYSVVPAAPTQIKADCIVAGVYENARLSPGARALDKQCKGKISAIIRRGDLPAHPGKTLILHDLPGLQAARVLLVACGDPDKLDESHFGKIVDGAASALADSASVHAVSCLPELEVQGRDLCWRIRRTIELTEAALYRFQRMKSEPGPERSLSQTTLPVSRKALSAATDAAAAGEAIARGVNLARDLGNMPGNICTPSWLAEQARELAHRHPAVKTRILEEKDMQALGMGALLAVSRGSREPARLIVMEYRGGASNARPLALVGKGLTFDSGGISIKPGAGMDEMKFDMCGGASVFGTIEAVATLGLPINVVGIVPSSENMPDGAAFKPGDILTSMSGQTIEVLNTDAEGRLILCDALTYCQRFNPRAIVDIATLTGACVIALGHHASGLFSNQPVLARELLRAGETSGDRAWELPLWEDYQAQIDSKVADIANVGGRDAGSITAACFLARFARDQRWAHLDIAGSAWNSGANKGATGRPVGLLTSWLMAQADRQRTRQ